MYRIQQALSAPVKQSLRPSDLHAKLPSDGRVVSLQAARRIPVHHRTSASRGIIIDYRKQLSLLCLEYGNCNIWLLVLVLGAIGIARSARKKTGEIFG